MKKFTQFGLAIFAVFISSQSFASIESVKVPTTCYVFKDNKLTSKSKCINEHSEGFAGVTVAIIRDEYRIKGKKPIVYLSSDDSESDHSKQTLNDLPSISQARDAKTYKVLGENQHSKKSLNCYKQETGSLEICTPDIDTNPDREHGDLRNYGK